MLLSEVALQATKSFRIPVTMCMYLEVALLESLSNHCDWILGLRSGVIINLKSLEQRSSDVVNSSVHKRPSPCWYSGWSGQPASPSS